MTIDEVLKDIQELKNSKAARVNELKHMISETEREITVIENDLAVIRKNKDTAETTDIAAEINRETELETELEQKKRQLELTRGQLTFTQDTKNYLDIADFKYYQNELETAYNETKGAVYSECQTLAEQLTKQGEKLVAARNKANKAMSIAFDLFHGNNVIEERTERVCIGDHTAKDENGVTHVINDFENRTKHFEYRVQPTIGTESDVAGPRQVSEIYNTRGRVAWWNGGKITNS